MVYLLVLLYFFVWSVSNLTAFLYPATKLSRVVFRKPSGFRSSGIGGVWNRIVTPVAEECGEQHQGGGEHRVQGLAGKGVGHSEATFMFPGIFFFRQVW